MAAYPCPHILTINGKRLEFSGSAEFKKYLADGGLKELSDAGLISEKYRIAEAVKPAAEQEQATETPTTNGQEEKNAPQAQGQNQGILNFPSKEEWTAPRMKELAQLLPDWTIARRRWKANKEYEEAKAEHDKMVAEQAPVSAESPATEAGPSKEAPLAESSKQSGHEVKKTISTKRAYEGEVREGVKKYLEENGLTRRSFSPEERSAQADDFINTHGEDASIEAVRNLDVRGAMATSILTHVAKRLDDEFLLAENMDSERATEIFQKQADIIGLLEREGYFGGEFSGQLAYEYPNSDIGYNLTKKIEEWKAANEGKISPEMEKRFTEINDKLILARKRVAALEKELQEKQEMAGKQGDIVRDKKIKSATRALAEAIRKGKLHRPGSFAAATPGSVVWDAAVEIVASTFEITGSIAQGVSDGLKYIADSDWYKSLTDAGKKNADDDFRDWFSQAQEKEKERIAGLNKKLSDLLNGKTPDKKKRTMDSPEIKAIKAQISLERQKIVFKKKIADIKSGIIATRPKPNLITNPALSKARAEVLHLKDEFDKEFYKNKLKNRTSIERAKDSAWDAWNLFRVLQATGEFSFVGVQNLINVIAHPLHAGQAFKNAIKLMTSEKKTEDWINEIKSQDYYPEAKENKLSLIEPHAELTARDELFYSDWINGVWNLLGSPLKLKGDKAYQIWKNLSPPKAIERAAVGFGDTMRILRWLDGKEMIRLQKEKFAELGIEFKDESKAMRQMTDVINTMTSRASLGPLEQHAKVLTKIFFSPKLWASRIKLATPYVFYYLGRMRAGARPYRPSVAQKIALVDFGKFVALTTSMTALIGWKLSQDDDPTTGVETDPRSSDFGKIRLGNIRVDPWGGMIQQVIFTSRLLADLTRDAEHATGIAPFDSMGGFKKTSGEVLPLGVPFRTPTKFETAIQMATNKLAPTASLIADYAMAKTTSGGSLDQYGNPYSFSQDLKQRLYPIYYGTLYDLARDGVSPLDGVLAFYAFFGGGVQVYTSKGKKQSSGPVPLPQPSVK